MSCPLSRSRLLEQIAMCEFVCIDLNLYLDTHPDDLTAEGDYNCYSEQLARLKEIYTHNYGPLENFGNSVCRGSWRDWDFSGYMFQGKGDRINAESLHGCDKFRKEV